MKTESEKIEQAVAAIREIKELTSQDKLTSVQRVLLKHNVSCYTEFSRTLFKLGVLRKQNKLSRVDESYFNNLGYTKDFDLCFEIFKEINKTRKYPNKKYYSKRKKEEKFIQIQHLSMTKDEYDKLCSKYGKSVVDGKLDRAKNYSKLNKYKSLYLTINNWISSDFDKPHLNLFNSETQPIIKEVIKEVPVTKEVEIIKEVPVESKSKWLKIFGIKIWERSL